MKIIKKLGGVLLAFVMLFSVSLAACNFGNNDEDKGAITGLYFVTEGLKTTYNVGETFDESQVKLTAVYERGSESLTLSSEGVTKSWSPELNKDKAGTYKLTATYKQKSAPLDITYIDTQEVLVSISIKPMKTAYVVGDSVKVEDIEIDAVYSTGKVVNLKGNAEGVTITSEDGDTMSEIDLSEVGEKVFTITYGGKTAELRLTVTEAPAQKALAFLYLDPNTISLNYTQGDVVDFSKAKFTAVYNDGTSKDVALGQNGVTASQFSTDRAGEFVVTFSYTEDGVTVSYKITLTVSEPSGIAVTLFERPQTYAQFLERQAEPAEETREDRVTYLKAMGTYKVGNENAFVFTPDVKAIDLSAGAGAGTQTVTLNAAKTTFKLSMKGTDDNFAEVEDSQYLMTAEEVKAARKENGVTEDTYTKPDSYYFFKEEAVGHVFKLEISLDKSYRTNGELAPITAEFEVVSGYNVYDQTGLSVLDNLNVKHWADIKNAAGALAWDLKPLKDYNSLAKNEVTKQIIFHNNINIDPDALPDYYFWEEGRKVMVDGKESDQGYATAYTDLANDSTTSKKNYHTKLNGSLRDYVSQGTWHNFNSPEEGDQKEDYNALRVNMQKAIYNIAGTSIEGNGMSLTYTTEGKNHRLYSVHDTEFETEASTGNSNVNPTGHWSIFKYVDEAVVKAQEAYPNADFDVDVTISNLTIQGNMPRLAQTDGEPPQLMGVNSAVDSVTFENCIVSRLYVVAVGDHGDQRSDVNSVDTKAFDVFSNMFYLWRSDLNVTNSILQEAGGPIAILCDGSEKGRSDDKEGPHMYIDDVSVIESFAAGTEPWYMLNSANALFTMVKGNIGRTTRDGLGREIVEKTSGVELVNVMAIIICEPGDLTGNFQPQDMLSITGGIYRGEKEKYEMNNTLADQRANAALNGMQDTPGLRASNAVLFQSGDLIAWTDLTNVTGLTPESAFQQSGEKLYGTWYSSREPSDLLFLSMRSCDVGNPLSVTSPRFGVLVGGVTKVAPPAQG